MAINIGNSAQSYQPTGKYKINPQYFHNLTGKCQVKETEEIKCQRGGKQLALSYTFGGVIPLHKHFGKQSGSKLKLNK